MAQLQDLIVNGAARIVGNITAPKFIGALQGTATEATKATQDGSGNTITSTYQIKSTAVTHTASTAVGSSSQPVYVNASGVATAVTMTDTGSALCNALSEGTSNPTDNDYYIAQYSGGGTTTTSYHRRSHSALASYIKGKFSAEVTGTGNAVTSIAYSNGKVTATKGTTFLTSHQDISGKADKTATVSTVTYDTTNSKITKTINGTTSDVVAIDITAGGTASSTSLITSGAVNEGLESLASSKADKASITAGTAGTSTATSGSTLAVPYVTMNAQGIVTGYGTHTHTVTGFLTSSSTLDAAKLSGTASINTTGSAGSATTASQNSSGYSLSNDIIKGLSVSGTTITYTKISGSTSTITTQDTTYSSKTAASGGTEVSLVTTGEKYTWNNKADSSHTHSYLPLGGGTMTGCIRRDYSSASADPAIKVVSNNLDVTLLRAVGATYATTTSSGYGYNLKYMGTGVDANNLLTQYCDNITGSEVIGWSLNQYGQMSIGSTPDTSYRLKVNGNEYVTTALAAGSSLRAPKVYVGSGTTYISYNTTSEAFTFNFAE